MLGAQEVDGLATLGQAGRDDRDRPRGSGRSPPPDQPLVGQQHVRGVVDDRGDMDAVNLFDGDLLHSPNVAARHRVRAAPVLAVTNRSTRYAVEASGESMDRPAGPVRETVGMVWETRRRELKSAPYELFVMLVTVLSILNLVLGFVLRSDQAMQDLLQVMNVVLSLILFCDFVYRFATAGRPGGLLLEGLRLGGPVREPARPSGVPAADLPAGSGEQAVAQAGPSSGRPRARRTARRQHLPHHALPRCPRAGVRQPRDPRDRAERTREPTSPRRQTHCGSRSRRSPPSATATSIPSPMRAGSAVR